MTFSQQQVLHWLVARAAHIRESESIGLHFRRTDFVGSGNEANPCYYRKELNRLLPALEAGKVHCFAFADDITWVKENFTTSVPITYIDKTTDQAEDMYLMSSCKHLIRAPASSFSWWAQLLGNQQGVGQTGG